MTSPIQTPKDQSHRKCGFVALIGAPNAGKSTLVNAMVGSKVSIVTQKVQTTRFPIRGIGIVGDSQLVFVDTPGFFQPKSRLERAMVASAFNSWRDGDQVVVVVDAQALSHSIGCEGASTPSPADKKAKIDLEHLIASLKSHDQKAILALNKIDGLKRDFLFSLSQYLFDQGCFTEAFFISANTGSGVDDLMNRLAQIIPDGPWLYPEDQIADAPMRLLAAEITREKLFLRVHDELPYAASVNTTAYETRPDLSIRITQDILVEREGQKGIIIGHKGQTLKWIGQKAREELETMIGVKIHLILQVKFAPNWSEDKSTYHQYGLDFEV